MPRILTAAVPPGVGDVYWVLTKLKAWRAERGNHPVRLLIQSAGHLDRAGQWVDMVDFVDEVRFYPFKPDRAALNHGLGQLRDGTPILWPNAIVDQGRHLADWLPRLPLDLSFPVSVDEVPGGPRFVLYVSSESINRAWMSHLPPTYWRDLVAELNQRVGRVTLIGARWDLSYLNGFLKAGPPLDLELLVGETTLKQVAGLLKSARFFVGVISGMTILANHFRTPTVALYPTAHHERFPRTWVAPEAPYWPMRADRVPPAAELAAHVLEHARPALEAPPESAPVISQGTITSPQPVADPSTVAVLATGPSMSQELADKVRGRCRVVAVCNAYELAPWADALVCNDGIWWKVHPNALQFAGRKFCGQDQPGTEWLRNAPEFPAGSNSGYQGVRVAGLLGATRILLLGFDMRGDHYFGRHPEPLRNSNDAKFRAMAAQFRLWKGVPVLNCTPGSALTCFPMADLDEVLPPCN